MSYTSDLRAKNLLTDIDINIRTRLKKEHINVNLEFRVFDESQEDAILWSEGGLCFEDPLTKEKLGSNDAGWFIDKFPIFIVEGTFGTERGQFGDGQLNRISHPLGPALNGVYGVIMEPFVGQSFIKENSKSDLLSKNISYSYGRLKKEIALMSLVVSRKNKGKYLVMDPYDKISIENLLFEVIKQHIGMPNNAIDITNSILSKTEEYLAGYQYGELSRQKLNQIYYTDGSCITNGARYYTHNLESLTTSSKRDGHGLLGKNLIEMYLAEDKATAIFIRMDNNDFKVLLSRRAKEFTYIYNSPRINVYNLDDLVFDDPSLKDKILALKSQNLHVNTEKEIQKEIQKAFNSGAIKINKKS